MEEQRIGMMYVNLAKRRLADLWHSLFGGDLRRSPVVFWLGLVLLVGGPLTGWYLHRRGQFATLKRNLRGETQGAPVYTPRPGGAEALVLRRAQTPGANGPELLSAVLLPGLGMDVLHITAFVPRLGEVELLAAPTVDAMADGSAPPRTTIYDTRGALEAPWGGVLAGLVTPIGSGVTVPWHGHVVEIPAQGLAGGFVDGGLLSARLVDSSDAAPSPGGSTAHAVVANTDFNGHWLSRTDLHVDARLDGHALELTMTARNVGTQPEPMGMGWHPRLLLQGERNALELRLPGGDVVETGASGLPTGSFSEAQGVLARMQAHATALGPASLAAQLAHLKPGVLDQELIAELRDPERGYGVRLSTPPAGTRALRVLAPEGANYVSLGFQTNYDDPFGKTWSSPSEPGIATLLPGETFTWKVRLEIFPVAARSGVAP